jgi:hypothetical protein
LNVNGKSDRLFLKIYWKIDSNVILFQYLEGFEEQKQQKGIAMRLVTTLSINKIQLIIQNTFNDINP